MKKLVFAVLLAAFCGQPAFAQMMDMPMKEHGEGHGHGHMMESGTMDRMDMMMGMCLANAEKIGLSDDQLAKITPLHREMQKKQVRFKADLKLAEIDLAEVMDKRDFDLDKASALVKKIGEMKTAHHLDMLKAMKEVRGILTDEQFRKMKKMMAMEREEMKGAKRPMKKR